MIKNVNSNTVVKKMMGQNQLTLQFNKRECLTLPTKVPPIKTQGIKTKLFKFIFNNIEWSGKGKWVEPFFGSGVVLFNMSPKNALATESNIHIVNLYKSIQNGKITAKQVRSFLEYEGLKLETHGETYYYEIRDRFNESANSFDFLFLNRACFNGLMRFNSKGIFNVPFCKKPSRFTKSYITKITNQVSWLKSLLENKPKWQFKIMDWRESVTYLKKDDFLYLDPPYYGRHANYYDTWDKNDLYDLAEFLHETKSSFALSLWYGNKYRKNNDIQKYFSGFRIEKYKHFYHIGATENLRNTIIEALITNT